MKYRDEKFLNYSENQEPIKEKNERSLKREHKRKLKLFYNEHLSKHFSKLWWNSLSESNQVAIMNEYRKVKLTDSKISDIKDYYKPEKPLWRDNLINEILKKPN